VAGSVALGVFLVACHRSALVQRNADGDRIVKDTVRVDRVVKDTVRVDRVVKDPTVVAIFKDTAVASVFAPPDARNFELRTPGQRDSLRAMLRRERARWQASAPRDYRFLLRVGCFCPGTRGWLVMEVRSGQPLRAWDRTGKAAALTDWNTLSIDGLFDNLERSVTMDGVVKVAFDRRWHFPTYVYTVALPGPDTWSITEALGFRPI